jgi:DNA (cytosine-5)-methyltransferase 1
MKILNLYAGVGSNCKLWPEKIFINGEWREVKITAVENNPQIAKIYKDLRPRDILIVGDAVEYLLKHFQEFDFIWASPPCQSHSIMNFANINKNCYKLPDITQLYGLIIFLKNIYRKDFAVENVKPYYKPLIMPDFCIGRHYFWSNKVFFDFNLNDGRNYVKDGKKDWSEYQEKDWAEIHGFNLSKYKIKNKRQILRNCVYPEIGKYVFEKITGLI